MYVNLDKDKEVKTMKYETPELTALTPAINAIQQVSTKGIPTSGDNPDNNEGMVGYQDWES